MKYKLGHLDYGWTAVPMDYVKHGEIQGRYFVFFKVTALYFTMSDMVHNK